MRFAPAAFGAALAFCGSMAFAEGVPAPPVVAAPDLVTLRGGGMLRGTIAEMAPTGNVLIVLATGEKRTVPMSDVKYAGPADRAPQESPPAAAPTLPNLASEGDQRRSPIDVVGDKVPVKFASDQAGLAFYVEATSASAVRSPAAPVPTALGYARICTAPCDGTVLAGTYRFALSVDDQGPVRVDGLTTIRTPASVRGHVDSNQSVRVIGYIFAIGGGIAGTGMAVAAGTDSDRRLLGLGVIAASTLIGVLGISTQDVAAIHVVPLSTAAASAAASGRPSDLRASLPDGAALAITF